MQVWVWDEGNGITMEYLHRATLERGYTTAGTLGHGFWLMLNMVDRLWLLTGPQGTTPVMEQDATPPEALWLKAAAPAAVTARLYAWLSSSSNSSRYRSASMAA